MPVAEKALHTTKKNHSGETLIYAHDQSGHQLQLFGCISDALLKVLKKDYTIDMKDKFYMDVTHMSWHRESEIRLRRGGLIRILRNNCSMSQGELGKQLNVTGKYVSDLEQGRHPVSVKMAKQLSKVFNRKPERFLPLEL